MTFTYFSVKYQKELKIRIPQLTLTISSTSGHIKLLQAPLLGPIPASLVGGLPRS